MKFALNSQVQMIQILTNDVQTLILSLSYFITTVTQIKKFRELSTLKPRPFLSFFQLSGAPSYAGDMEMLTFYTSFNQ